MGALWSVCHTYKPVRVVASAIWVLVAQWLERLTRDQKVTGSIPVLDSETFSEFAGKLE